MLGLRELSETTQFPGASMVPDVVTVKMSKSGTLRWGSHAPCGGGGGAV